SALTLVGLDLGLDLLFSHALGKHLGKVDRVDHQRREAAIAGGVGDDLAGEGEEQARALDEEDRQHMFLRKAGDAEDAAIGKLGIEQNLVAVLGFRVQRQDDVEVVFGERIGVD